MSLSVAFRVDASYVIGIGHFMRCVTLANELKKNGVKTRFVCRYLPESLHSVLTPYNHELKILNHSKDTECLDELAHSHFLGISQHQDAIDTLSALSDQKWDWIIIDHYAIDIKFEKLIRKNIKKIMVIDDIADRMHDCNILLDQNLYEDMQQRYVSKVPEDCKLLLGPTYALLRDEFLELRTKLSPRKGPVKEILIFFGGVDPEDLTTRTINVFSEIADKSIKLNVVIGSEHPNRIKIEEICRENGYKCFVQTPKMAELMARSDLAIGAGGSTSWERCCLGVASILVSFADNQYDIATSLDKVGASIFIGNEKSATHVKIKETLQKFLDNSTLLASTSKKAFLLVDGRGTQRVYNSLNNLK